MLYWDPEVWDAANKVQGSWLPVPVASTPASTSTAVQLPPPTEGTSWYLSSWQTGYGYWIKQPVLSYQGWDYIIGTPQEGIDYLNQLKGFGMGGPIDTFIAQFQAVLGYWVRPDPSMPWQTVNKTATFSVRVTGGKGPFAYNWTIYRAYPGGGSPVFSSRTETPTLTYTFPPGLWMFGDVAVNDLGGPKPSDSTMSNRLWLEVA